MVYPGSLLGLLFTVLITDTQATSVPRQRINLNKGWRFWRSVPNPDGVIYDHLPNQIENATVLKPWILPSGNEFIMDKSRHHKRPDGDPEIDIPFVQSTYQDDDWESVNLPHDWAISGPFYEGENPVISGGMGRLPVHGVGWYRRKLDISRSLRGKRIHLDIDGAMSYAMVWLNGHLVGVWPYGYNSFRLDLTPFMEYGENQLAIRLDNAPDSSRWYPGAGLYRSVWLTVGDPTQVSQWGTYITTRDVSKKSAILDLSVQVQNKAGNRRAITVETDIFTFDPETGNPGEKVGTFLSKTIHLSPSDSTRLNSSTTITNPRLWGPPPSQKPNLYVAVTRLNVNNEVIDEYKTQFGIRSFEFNSNKGVFVNGEKVPIQCVNQHSDLGALGMAFNVRAAERQLEILKDMGCNSIRMSHNPPAVELLDLTDKMGFLVIDEIFDAWERNKTAAGFHLLFPDWHEPDLRAFIRRDRNHPSIISWSYGNEVGEQYTAEEGAAVSKMLQGILREEDSTRPSSASENYATPGMPFPQVLDILNINYQGAGIRNTEAYSNLQGIHTHPLYPDYHKAYPDGLVLGSETASTLSSRGVHLFPVTNYSSAPVNDTSGGNSTLQQVSAYELYSAPFGSSPDKVFAEQDRNPYVAGEFVWTGFDYIGEPTPYYSARSSYSGIVDLAGFKKDRFWLYQTRWRPNERIAHIMPHWTWPERVGEVTPVHVFSEADEAELFLNGHSQGRRIRNEYDYRFRWDDVVYEPGELHVVTFRNGEEWANNTVTTARKPSRLRLTADRGIIRADGEDLAFIALEVTDDKGLVAPRANNEIQFSISGPGEVIATDNGNAADFVAFPSHTRSAFSGLSLVIVRLNSGAAGSVTVSAEADGLKGTSVVVGPV
ncbi:uncharacterized protein NECHADRAFT_56078 [Fusarium vanettenii 77-13-4]|uniref:Glycoside hydrolase family 2 n=1 Tax=Fusarium vanettenii (strain ATCC MYA-4622 / CBS 123669 / FGSC 9596 / NRRL 45880 / 77-13-4) TaxID=660122 RepID=C7ZQC3_FUSV7|nr:uncharacterized protein NECHADRAFT_56078 [Fusarium vanettenii 77-13-4]EEU33776.1 hypothetical protein NECHADRAFT_56078 [Fusarium vanettenii 77-13-4]